MTYLTTFSVVKFLQCRTVRQLGYLQVLEVVVA